MSNRHDVRERIRAAALRAGFDQVGFAPAETPTHAEAYRAWLDRGYHGEMAYMAREDAVRRRIDPAMAVPGARTIIVVSLVYGPDHGRRAGAVEDPPSPAGARCEGLVARYAHGRDYHDVFEERLDALLAAVREEAPAARARRYVDYGPVLERDHAQRAGLGWIGKNTMLIHPTIGSYLMLGELITDLDLQPDEPFLPDRCGSCDRCIEACPTQAILDGRMLDARRCISYLTIELRGPIPREYRRAIGTRVFGCDICQEVCPWNTDAETPETSPFDDPPSGRPWRSTDMVSWAQELARLDEQGFKARYRGTALSRPGRDGLLRNLAVGLGNSGDLTAVSTLEMLAADASELVAEHARWGLEELHSVTG
ncbi:MAG: tRNA epoxyqueuosine(34) reductase QueG [Gemmatimonadota bacterium]|nr:tRNA epoxyqueuosine(34) reductase QueG [Gemmatimonadota bacterium]